MESRLNSLHGFDKWIIEKANGSYIETLQDRKDNLVCLNADSETLLDVWICV